MPRRRRNIITSGADSRTIRLGVKKEHTYRLHIPAVVKDRLRHTVVRTTTGVKAVGWTPGRTVEFEEAVRAALWFQHPYHTPYAGRLAVAVLFQVSHLRGDLDNYLKAVLDGAQPRKMKPGIIKNDSLIDAFCVRREVVPPGKEAIYMTVRPLTEEKHGSGQLHIDVAGLAICDFAGADPVCDSDRAGDNHGGKGQ